MAEETAGLIQFLVDGLQPGTLYYARAFVTNAQGTAYGNQVSFTTNSILNPALTYGTVTDQDGNTYATITIGTQTWMAENLRSTTYANGDPILNVTGNDQWVNLSTGAWAHYENNASYDVLLGKLYNWYAVADSRNVCPANWHVPSDVEWQQLEEWLGMPVAELDAGGIIGTAQNVGGKLKTTGAGYWTTPNAGASNESGFAGPAGGYRKVFDGGFASLLVVGFWWTASGFDASLAISRYIHYDFTGVTRLIDTKKEGYSVRCVMD